MSAPSLLSASDNSLGLWITSASRSSTRPYDSTLPLNDRKNLPKQLPLQRHLRRDRWRAKWPSCSSSRRPNNAVEHRGGASGAAGPRSVPHRWTGETRRHPSIPQQGNRRLAWARPPARPACLTAPPDTAVLLGSTQRRGPRRRRHGKPVEVGGGLSPANLGQQADCGHRRPRRRAPTRLALPQERRPGAGRGERGPIRGDDGQDAISAVRAETAEPGRASRLARFPGL